MHLAFSLVTLFAALLVTSELSNGFQQEIRIRKVDREFVKGKTVATSYVEFSRFSEARCLQKCLSEAIEGKCKVAGSNRDSRTVY